MVALLHWVVDTRRHLTLRVALRRYVSTTTIIQLPKDKGLQGYVGRQILFKNLHKEKGYSRTRDEEDTKVRYDITINTVRANYIVRRSDDEITDVGQLRIIRQ
jgi:hypothetical protein